MLINKKTRKQGRCKKQTYDNRKSRKQIARMHASMKATEQASKLLEYL